MTLDSIIPRPQSIVETAGVLKVSALGIIQGQVKFGETLRRNALFMGVDFARGSVPVVLELSTELKVESFKIEITPEKVTVTGGDEAGLFYGVGAFEQLLCVAVGKGPVGAEIPCGVICDSPRFSYRGFMIDSARHFQSVATIKKILQVMAKLRLNVFHWHLIDNEGYRTESKIAPQLNQLGNKSPGFYTPEDIAEIRAMAAEYFITIIPEIEMPGHSRGLMSLFPELACNPEDPRKEFCLTKPEVKKFLEDLIREFVAYFPESKILHIGGDEADTDSWDACPLCQKQMKDRGLNNIRELENAFMNDMAAFVRSLGLTPVTWFTGSIMETQTIIQVWRSIHELRETARVGNRMIFSVHDQLYLDYPADSSEPFENWMMFLPEEGVYNCEPYAAWENEIGDLLLGAETCLWTEIVPDHRTMGKIMPRIPAFAETSWSINSRREWFNFSRRKEVLNSCGWFELEV